MSDKKELILAQLRSRYESKYGSNDALKQVITSELSKISKKKKINFEDLSELESKISSASKTASLLTTSHESTLPNSFLSPKIRNKINQLEKIRSIENSPVREHHNSTNPSSDDKSPTSALKLSVNASLSNIVLPPISPTYLTPMELKILKSHTNNALKNSRFLLDDSIEENNESSLAVSRSTNLSPIRKDQSPVFRMPAGQKGQEREKALSQNIWKKINEHNLKRAEEEENQKAEKLRNKKQEWLQNLQKQISDKKDKASTLKNKDMIWSQKSIEIDLQRKVDEEEKEKMHKRKMRSLERENFAEMFNEKDELKKRLAEQKEKEALQALYENEAYSEKKKVFEENNKRKKKQLNEILEEDLNNKISQTKEKTTKNKEDDEKMNRNIIEKLEQDQGKSEEFLRALKERARRMPDAELSKVKGYDNLRQYGQIGANEDNSQGLMKFLYADRHNEQARTQKKMVNQSVLQKSYEHQRSIRVEKVKEYKNYIAEQKDLWKKEEEDMNAREELTTKVTKLKRQAQKEGLDAQREMDAPLKVQTVSQNEAWVNKSTLKELQVIPEKNHGKMPYLKGF